jgi:cohesin loading factor subunit SCC2
MEPHNTSGPYNGFGSQQDRPDPQRTISRPFTLQEAIPYSPQTSTVPFLPGQHRSDTIPYKAGF